VENFGLKWMPIVHQDMVNKGALRSCNYHTNSPFVVNVYTPTPENKNVYAASSFWISQKPNLITIVLLYVDFEQKKWKSVFLLH